MRDYTLTHLRDEVLLRDLAALLAQDRVTTATLLAHIAEADARRLYVPAGYPSMHAYCVEELRLSEDAASKRIQAARAARRLPALFTALAEGRLHLSAVCLLAPHLTAENAKELIEAATHRRKSEIEQLLARRFPPPEMPTMVRALATTPSGLPQHALGHVGADGSAPAGTFDEHAPGHVDRVGTRPAVPSLERCLLTLTIAKSTEEKLRYAQALLSHAVPTGDVGQVIDRALDALITRLEKRKFGATTGRPRGAITRPRRPCTTVGKRHVPAHVRRAVWERDQGQCTFVGGTGHRCNTRRFLEFDHVHPVARGGKATVDGMRLRCRTHNQYEAERAFGADFMRRKRHQARLAAAEARAGAWAKEQTQDVLAGLRSLGCRADQARRAAKFSETLHGASLEERMRASLKFLCGRSAQGPAPPEGLHLRKLGAARPAAR